MYNMNVVTVAKFQGGGAFNVIPDSVTIGGTFRAFQKKALTTSSSVSRRCSHSNHISRVMEVSSVINLCFNFLCFFIGDQGSDSRAKMHSKGGYDPRSIHDPRSILKTIENGKDIIDCVDIYKQPAFNHPLLKNHTLQLKPSSYPFRLEDHNSSEVLHTHQFWERNGQNCPQGTVPILRKSMTYLLPKKTHPPRASSTSSTNSEAHTEYVTGFLTGTSIHGTNGNINVWQPQVYPNEIVVAQFWVTDNDGYSTTESIEAGYLVSPSDPKPQIFVYWTSDGYKSTGCYNLDCPGFVQTSVKGSVLGAVIQPISKYGDSQQQIISIKFRRVRIYFA
ncbi:IAA-amino acid hydrolase ILR1-like 4 [Linum perenne]